MSNKIAFTPSCTLTNEELIKRCDQWVHSLAETGGHSWVLQVPVNFNRDPDMLFIELGKRLKEATEALEKLLPLANELCSKCLPKDMDMSGYELAKSALLKANGGDK